MDRLRTSLSLQQLMCSRRETEMLQLLAHLIGDYILQSDWMANEKTKSSWPATAHAVTYTLPFLMVAGSVEALAFIYITHFIIDRWRLARYVCWFKNVFAPASYRYPWKECSATGYHESRPAWLSVWLLIIADNTMHLCCNAFAIAMWGG